MPSAEFLVKEADLKYTGIHHIALITDDMDKTIRFWRDLLGMKMLAATGDGQNRQYFFEICENNILSFFEWPEAVNAHEKLHGEPTDEPQAFDHVALGLKDDAALEEMKNLLESATDVRGRSLRDVLRMSDRNICDAASEGHDPQSGKGSDGLKI